MNIDAFERCEQALELRAKIMQAEEERLSRARTRSISEARRELRARAVCNEGYRSYFGECETFSVKDVMKGLL